MQFTRIPSLATWSDRFLAILETAELVTPLLLVSDPALHRRVCDEVRQWFEGLDFAVQGIVESPITGPEGNIEFLISASRN